MNKETDNPDDDKLPDEADDWIIEQENKRRGGAEIRTRFAGIEVYTAWDDDDSVWITEDTGISALEMNKSLRSAIKEHFDRVVFIMEEEGLLDERKSKGSAGGG